MGCSLVNKPGVIFSRFFKSRDELSFRNIRKALLPVILIFPVSVIMGNLRYFDHSIAFTGFATHELTFFFLGLGWFILFLSPKRFILPLLCISALASFSLMLTIFFMPWGFFHFVIFMSAKFFNGLACACAFYLFCFVLNNVERLFAMLLIQLFYAVFYGTYSTFPALHQIMNAWGSIVLNGAFLLLVLSIFFIDKLDNNESNIAITGNDNDGKGSGVPYVIALCVVHYMITCMFNYIEWMDNNISGFAFGAGTLISIALILIIQLFKGKNAMYIWLMFLAFSMLGLGALLFDSHFTFMGGSFIYGLGDSLGYIIIYYICAGAIKKSQSHKMFRLFCLVFFLQYFLVSGFFSFYFNFFEAPNRFLAFAVVMVMVSLCLMFMPLIQKRLFDADWTDGLYLRDMPEYSSDLSADLSYELLSDTSADSSGEKEQPIKESLNLTPREEEIFVLLLKGIAPKEIAYTLKISYDTVNFHQKNLYRKLGIQSRAELFARYLNRE